MSRVFSFSPIIDERARVLVAGTAPSVKSLEHGQFYGHPQNYFWRVVYAMFRTGEPQEGRTDEPAAGAMAEQAQASAGAADRFPAPDPVYANRIAFLQRHRLALWDVIESCEREGSLDANIHGEIPNDFPGLLRRYPGIRCIAFNGSKAYDTFRKAFGQHPAFDGIALLKLPSTSPIPTKHMRSLDDRVRAWSVILPYAQD